MRDMKELCRIIEEELGKIAEKGLNTSNLETAYKLIDMYKDIKNTEYWDTKCEYSVFFMSLYISISLYAVSRLEVFKLIDMYKDIKNTEYWDTKCEYYETVLDEMRGDGSSYAMEHDHSGRHYDNRRHSRNDGYARGSSYARRGEHYVRGHYSRSDGGDHYDEYMDNKHSYRNGDKSADCKQRMVDALERHMDALTDEIGEMSRDSDCVEEKRVIEKYIDKLKRMM